MTEIHVASTLKACEEPALLSSTDIPKSVAAGAAQPSVGDTVPSPSGPPVSSRPSLAPRNAIVPILRVHGSNCNSPRKREKRPTRSKGSTKLDGKKGRSEKATSSSTSSSPSPREKGPAPSPRRRRRFTGYQPALPMLPYHVPSSRSLKREHSFIEVNIRDTHVKWVSPYLADMERDPTSQKMNASVGHLKLVPPIPGAMMPVYEEILENVACGSPEVQRSTVQEDNTTAASSSVEPATGSRTRLASTSTPNGKKRTRDTEEDGDVSPRPLRRMRSAELMPPPRLSGPSSSPPGTIRRQPTGLPALEPAFVGLSNNCNSSSSTSPSNIMKELIA